MKCKELMVDDWISQYGVPRQIIFVGNGYATYEVRAHNGGRATRAKELPRV